MASWCQGHCLEHSPQTALAPPPYSWRNYWQRVWIAAPLAESYDVIIKILMLALSKT